MRNPWSPFDFPTPKNTYYYLPTYLIMTAAAADATTGWVIHTPAPGLPIPKWPPGLPTASPTTCPPLPRLPRRRLRRVAASRHEHCRSVRLGPCGRFCELLLPPAPGAVCISPNFQVFQYNFTFVLMIHVTL